jgi:hypothetical protein
VRFGYGTGDVWVTRTTSDTVLTEESWNHVVLSFGPEYRLDGTFEQYRAVLYVNNVVRADWGMGEAPPVAIASDFFVGRASDKAEIYVDRFKVLRQADESPHCEIRMSWDDEEIDEWGGLDPDEERDVHFSAVFRNEGKLRAWEDDDGAESGHNYSDDPLCDLELNNCEGRGRTFTTHDPADPRITLDWEGDDKSSSEGLNHEDRTRIEIYLGASGKPAFANPSVPFHGRMDELIVYKRPLSAVEVQELYFSASMAMRLPFDDPPGSETFRDTVDVSLHGGAYCSGSACPTAGINGRDNQAARFDGMDDVVYTDLHLDQSAEAGGATLAVWARPASASPGVHDVIRGSQQGWSLVRAGDVWRVYQPGAGPLTTVSAPVDVGQWQHLVAVFDPHAGVTLYKNGVAVASTDVLLTSDVKTALSVGASFDGALDDVRVFNRPLAPADVETLYYHAPVFQLHLDEPHGGTPPFRDAAGGLEATCAHQCPASGLGGQVGLAAGFNLNADKLTDDLVFDRTPALQSRAFTIGAWVQPASVEGGRLIHNGFQSFLSLSDALFPTVGVYYGNYSVHKLRSITPVASNQWSHVMGTYDGADLRIYVNGYLQGELATTFDAITDTDKLRIGDQDFVGRLDEVVIYNRALAPDEIRDLFLYQGKLVEAHSATQIMVDNEPPASKLRSYNAAWPYAGPEGVALHVEAHDETSSVSLLELGVDGAYTAAPPCADAVGDASWCPFFDPRGKEGTYQLTTRATDITGHRETPETTYMLHVDATPPDIARALTSGELVAATRHPTLQGHWIAHLSGMLADPALAGGAQAEVSPGSGVDPEAVFVSLYGSEGVPLGAVRQLATVLSETWSIDYVFSGARPTGRYTVAVAASDRLGNAASVEISTQLHLDAAAPAADLDLRDDVPMSADQPVGGLVSELPLPKDTLLALRFEDEAGATTFYDSSGGQRHGICLGLCPDIHTGGQSGRAANFGFNDVIYLSRAAATGISALQNDLSIAAWIKPSVLDSSRPLVAAGRASAHNGWIFGLEGDALHFETVGVHDYVLPHPGLQVGQWTHVAAVMDEQNDVTFYVNGAARGTATHNQPASAQADAQFFVGSNGSTSFLGLLDEVVVVGRALEADEIHRLAQTRTVGVASVEAAFRSVLPGSPFQTPSQPDALAFHLPLDDAPDASDVGSLALVELAEQGATATCTGGACPDFNVPGQVGSAVRLDGQEDTLVLNDHDIFTTTTVAAWIKLNDATGVRQTVLAYKEQADCGFVLALDGAGDQPYAAFNVDGAWATVADADALPVDTWVHLAASYDGATLHLYRDGDLVAETTVPGALAQCTAGSAIGSNPAGNADFFSGALDDLRVYRRALDAAEIETLYLGRDPLLALNFDVGQGWATDGAGLADDAVWNHEVTLHTRDARNKVTPGQEGAYALTFDGSDDHVAVAAAPSLALDHDVPAFTQAAWVNVAPQDNELYPIFSSAAYDTPERQYPFLQIIERDRLVVGFGDGAALHTFTTDPVLTPGTWQHIAGVFDGQTYTVYVDGEPVAATDQFAGLQPGGARRFDVGRGARAEVLGCATLDEVALTGATWEQQWRVRYQGEIIYVSAFYPTAGRAYAIPLQTAFCGTVPFEVEARYWDTATGWNWTSLGTFDLTPAPGVRSHAFSAGGRAGTLTWHTTTPEDNLRYFRGQIDAVRLYPGALGPLDVRRLYEGRWQPATLAEDVAGVDVTAWRAQAPAGLEGAYALDARGWDRAGHADNTGLSQSLWSGELDTLAPRVAITRTVVGDRYHYETVAEDFNLVRDGFSSPCGAGVGEGQAFNATWYRTTLGTVVPGQERLYRFTAECDTPATGLFQTGVWDEQPWITGGAVVVTGTGGTMAYVPAGRLWQVDVSDPARPRLDDIYPAVQHAQGVALDDDHAYVVEGVYGLSVLSLADPAAPAAGYDTPGEAMDVAAAGDYVVVADGSGGLRVVDVRDPANPAEVGAVATEGDALGVVVSGMPTTTLKGITNASNPNRTGTGRALPAPIPAEPVAAMVTDRNLVQEPTKLGDDVFVWDRTNAAFVRQDFESEQNLSPSNAGVDTTPAEAAQTQILSGAGYVTARPVQGVQRSTPPRSQDLTRLLSTLVTVADDAYVFDEDTVLTVTVPGILGNDSRDDSGPLASTLISDPVTGTLVLKSGGAFTYTPPLNYDGVVTFTYQATTLRGYWPLDEGRGVTTTDYCGKTGVFAGSNLPQWLTPTVGLPPVPADNAAAVKCDGLNCRVALGTDYLDGAYPSTDEPLTLAAWVKPEVIASDQNFVSSGNYWMGTPTSSYRANYLGIRGGNYTIGSLLDTTDHGAFFPIPPEDVGEWVHIAGTYDQDTRYWHLYRNGVEVDYNADLTGVLGLYPNEFGGGAKWVIGGGEPASCSECILFSSVDEVRIYDSALSVDEIAVLASGIYPDPPPSNTATVTLTIVGINDPPVAHSDAYTTPESTLLTVTAPGVLANDNDVEGDLLTVTVETLPAHGALTLDATGAFTYTPAPYYYGTDAFTYRANDGVLDSLPTTVTLTVNPVNDPPVAVADVYTPTEDVLFIIGAPGVLDNDQDVEHDPLTATLVTTPTHGVLALVDDGSFQYMPDADYNGADAFTYYANDGELDSNTVTVTLNVAAVNDAPVAHSDAYTTAEDVLLNVAAPGVLANDDDVDGDILQATVVQSPTVGSLTLAGNGALLYEPPLNAYGVVTFTYRVSDGGLSATATVTLTLTAVDDPPDVQADAYTTNLNTPLTVAAPGLLGNDSDPEGAGLTATLATAPGHGDATVALDGALTYTPTVGYHGVDTFAYRVSDGGLSAMATVTLTVNGPPSAGDVAIFTQEEISTTLRLIPDHTSDPEGDTLVVSAVGAPLSGTATLSGTTGVTYTPVPNFSGVDTFIYTVADPGGLTATGRITVTVGGINDAPVAVDDVVTTPEDRPVTVVVMDNDSDPDGQTPQLLSVGAPVQGSARIVGSGVAYTPRADFYGTDGFTYLIGDGVLTATARVTVTVTAVNDLPTLAPPADRALEPSAGEQVVALSGIGAGAPNESQPLDVIAASSNPTLIPDPSIIYDGASTTGELRFTPTAGLTGTATVSVTVSDGLSETLRTFNVTVWDATGPFAYVAAGEAGLLVIDLSRQEAPRELARLATPDAAQDVALVGETVYVAAGAGGLLLVDVSTPLLPQILGHVTTPGYAGGVSVRGNQVFVADGPTGVTLVDAIDPGAPYLVSRSDTPGYAGQLTAVGHTLYVADGDGGLRLFDTVMPPGQATACDRAGNCTTAAATALYDVELAAEPLASPTTGVRILSVPPLLLDTAPLTVTGKAFTEIASLQALTLTIDGSTHFTQTWANGVVSATIWRAPWEPTGLPDGPHVLDTALTTWDGTQVSGTLTVTLDTQAPQLAVATAVLTHAHYQASGALVVEGLVVDAGGVAQVALLSGGESHAATVEGHIWKAPWYLPTGARPDGETYTVTVQATDIAGRVKRITPTLQVDIAPPSAPALTLSHAGTPLAPGAVVRELSPTLTLGWTASSDGSGPVDYAVEWLVTAGGVQTVVTGTAGLSNTAAYTAPEAAEISARLGVRDRYGHTRWERVGPVTVDAPRTPDDVSLRDGVRRGWMASGCALLGVDRRMRRDAVDTATLNAEQRLYGTWDGTGLRLAWTGANWDEDGDLFLYFDTGPGGTTTAFDPSGMMTTTLHLPGVTPTGTVGAMAADTLVWVRDAETALLLHWQEAAGRWQIVRPLSAAEYGYDAALNNGQTDLYLPFDPIGLMAGSSLDLVAFATEEGALDVWATLPSANPLNSGRVVETAALADDAARFALLHRYHWERVGDGVCPNGSDGSSPAYPDTEVQAQLSAVPEGVAYSLVDSGLFWLWEQLTGDKPADVSSYFDKMSTEHPHVGTDQTLTYSLRYRNTGRDTATGLYADVTAHYALRLRSGQALRLNSRQALQLSSGHAPQPAADDVRLQFPLGDLSPGAEQTVSFQGVIDLARSAEPWAALTVELYDDAHPSGGPPLERLWLDHQVDRAAPQFVGITQPAYVLGAGPNRVQGYVYDDSPVTTLSLDLVGGPALDCPDATPWDGAWTCTLDASDYGDGAVITATVAAEDAFGQRSAPSAPHRWVVDTIPPTVTLTKPEEEAGLLIAESAQLAGGLFDNHGLAGAEVCLDGTCSPATVVLSGTETTRIDTDAPVTPLSIAGGACAGGSGIVRTFNVTESFTLGGVSVNFRAQHPHRDDLDVKLVAPSGDAVVLLTGDGLSGTAYRHYNVLLDDRANGSYAAPHDDGLSGSSARPARPVEPLAAFVGQEAGGEWRLTICDSDPTANDGAYLGSQLHLSPTPAQKAARTGIWSTLFRPAAGLDYVAQALQVFGIDLAGNRTTEALQLDVIADNVAPVLTVTHVTTRATFAQSLDVLVGALSDGSLTAGGGEGIRLSVLVDGPNGTYDEPATREGTRWSYALRPAVPGTYRLSVSAYDGAGNVTAVGPFQVQVMPWQQVYLPVVGKHYVAAPDLFVNAIHVEPEDMKIVITNRGSAPVVDSFWVDLYVNPTERPWEVNETWNLMGTQGAVWGVTTPIQPGDALTLTVADAFYYAGYSHLTVPLQIGDHVYVQVDSAGAPAYGGVREDHEILAWGYNNIAETTVSATTTWNRPAFRIYKVWDTQTLSLPPRP